MQPTSQMLQLKSQSLQHTRKRKKKLQLQNHWDQKLLFACNGGVLTGCEGLPAT